jgi:hypothetical protein
VPVAIGQVDPVAVLRHELGEAFAGQLSDATIATLVEEEVAGFEKARIRDFVPLLAGRKARARAKSIIAVDRTAAPTAEPAND